MDIRDFVQRDLPQLVSLLNRAYGESYEFIPYSEDKLLSWIEEGNQKILVAVQNGEVLGSVAYRSEHWGEEIGWLAVLERADRKPTEDALVSEIEKHFRGETVFTAVDVGSPKTREWIERGYKPEGGLYHIVARLEGLKPLPKIPLGTIIRSLKPEEEEEFVEAVNAGFGSERLKLGAIQKWKSEGPPFSEEWICVAEIDKKIVSVVVSRLMWNTTRSSARGEATWVQRPRFQNIAAKILHPLSRVVQ
jgi:hypothetical protein